MNVNFFNCFKSVDNECLWNTLHNFGDTDNEKFHLTDKFYSRVAKVVPLIESSTYANIFSLCGLTADQTF